MKEQKTYRIRVTQYTDIEAPSREVALERFHDYLTGLLSGGNDLDTSVTVVEDPADDPRCNRSQLEPPMCDNCGEGEVTVRCELVGLCDDCAAKELRAALLPLMGRVCANVLRHDNGHLQVCLAPFGVEHDHS